MPRYEGAGPPYNPGPGRHWEYTVSYLHHDEIPTVTHEGIIKAGKIVVMTNRFRPTGVYATKQDAIEKMVVRYINPTSVTPDRAVDITLRGESDKPIRIHRIFCHFDADGSSISLKQGDQRGSLIEVL